MHNTMYIYQVQISEPEVLPPCCHSSRHSDCADSRSGCRNNCSWPICHQCIEHDLQYQIVPLLSHLYAFHQLQLLLSHKPHQLALELVQQIGKILLAVLLIHHDHLSHFSRSTTTVRISIITMLSPLWPWSAGRCLKCLRADQFSVVARMLMILWI